MEWTSPLEGFPVLLRQRCVVVGGTIVVIGFRDGNGPLQVILVDPRDCSWRRVQRPRTIVGARRMKVVAVHDGMYVFDEYFQPDDIVYVDYFDIKELRWTSMETNGDYPRDLNCEYAWVTDGSIFIASRGTGQLDRFVYCRSRRILYELQDTFFALNLSTMTWRQVTNIAETISARRRNENLEDRICTASQMVMSWDCFTSLDDFYYVWAAVTGQQYDLGTFGWKTSPSERLALFTYRGHKYVLRQPPFPARQKALRCLLDGKWCVGVDVGGEPSGSKFECVAVAGDKAFFFMEARGRPSGEVCVLELAPSLRTLCLLAVRRLDLDFSGVPVTLREELQSLSHVVPSCASPSALPYVARTRALSDDSSPTSSCPIEDGDTTKRRRLCVLF